MLHVWHHATTFQAFYIGMFTGAGFWIGFFNSFIHIVMYAYYAKIPGMKVIAKYITSMQIFHLFGGAVCNLYTIIWPIPIPTKGMGARFHGKVDVRTYSIINMFIC